MKSCHHFNNSQENGRSICVFRREAVTQENFADISEVVSPDQSGAMEEGDVVSVICFENKTTVTQGTIIIWHNKVMAAVHLDGGCIWGNWDEAAGLVVTEEFEEGWTTHGEEISGRIAYNTYGLEGIFSCGEFYTRAGKEAAPIATSRTSTDPP